MRIFIGADHRGFALKQRLARFLSGKGHDVVDCGAAALNPDDDYPDFALRVAQKVAANPGSFGMLLCGSGLGMDVVANKTKGVRASLCTNSDLVAHGRSRDNLNVLCLPADSMEAHDAEALAELFLTTPYGNSERDARRQKKIAEIEEQNFK